MLLREGPTPLYRQIAEDFRARIRAGSWPPGYKLGAEPVLAAEWRVSRGTIRQALRFLASEGLIVQIQGKGTFVQEVGTTFPLLEGLVTIHEVLAESGIEAMTEVLKKEVQPGTNRARSLLDLPRDEPLLYVRRRLLRDGRPFAALDNYVRVKLCDALNDADLTRRPLFAVLEDECGLEIAWGRRNLYADAAGVMAGLLEVHDSAPVLRLEQVTYLADGTPIEYSEVWVHSQEFQITSLLSRPHGVHGARRTEVA